MPVASARSRLGNHSLTVLMAAGKLPASPMPLSLPLPVVISSSPVEIVEPLAGMLDVDRWIASKPRVVDGRYTGELEFYAYGPAKASAMEELAAEVDIDLSRSFAYSDSPTDLPMLESVGNPVVVNPDKALRRMAEEKGWRVESFRNPVTLRSRLPNIR